MTTTVSTDILAEIAEEIHERVTNDMPQDEAYREVAALIEARGQVDDLWRLVSQALMSQIYTRYVTTDRHERINSSPRPLPATGEPLR